MLHLFGKVFIMFYEDLYTALYEAFGEAIMQPNFGIF